MKKAMLRKLRALSNDLLGKKETDKIIEDTIKEVLKETEPKEKKKKVAK
jgi:hypothetical protein